MPSGGKQKKSSYHHLKPQGGYVHPSLTLRPAPVSTSGSTVSEGPATVNERIEHLRRTQTQHTAPEGAASVRREPLPTAERRRIAGPPPPRSWIANYEPAQNAIRLSSGRVGPGQTRRPEALGYFPGDDFPEESSLVHHVLKSMAHDFNWHLDYDHYYLSTLPVKLKGVLLSYIARYGPQDGLTVQALKVLFSTQRRSDISDSTGVEGLTRLDLGGSVGRSLSLKQLGSYWRCRNMSTSDSIAALPETWDAPPLPSSIESPLRFPSLTRLSLAFPGIGASWSDLLAISRHLTSITHLSLASWPTPRLASGVAPTLTPSKAPAQEDSWAEAAHILKQLSRNTPSLQYLDLDGCNSWLQALSTKTVTNVRATPRGFRDRAQFDFSRHVTAMPNDPSGGTEWSGSWRHISHVSVRQGWVPKGMNPRALHALYKARGQQPSDLANLTTQARSLAPETYSLFSSSHAVRESVQAETNARHERETWFKMETEALVLEAHVRRLRSEARARNTPGGGNAMCVFDHGWGREELLEAGYDENELWEAGF